MSHSASVSPDGWAHAAVMISAVLDNDSELFKQATAVPTRREHEALDSAAAAAVTGLAGDTRETPSLTTCPADQGPRASVRLPAGHSSAAGGSHALTTTTAPGIVRPGRQNAAASSRLSEGETAALIPLH